MRNSSNIFQRIGFDTVWKDFNDIYDADISSRASMMNKLYSKIKNGNGYNKKQKDLMDKCNKAFISASCLKEPCKDLLEFMNKSRPNISITQEKMNSSYSNLRALSMYTGFYFVPEDIPDNVSICMLKFRYFVNTVRPYYKTASHGDLLTVLLSKYKNSLSKNDYPHMWLIVSIIKQIELLSKTSVTDQILSKTIESYIKNLFSLLDCIIDYTNKIEGEKKHGIVQRYIKREIC